MTEIYLHLACFCIRERIKISFPTWAFRVHRSPNIGYSEFANLCDIILGSFWEGFDSLVPLYACHTVLYPTGSGQGFCTSYHLHHPSNHIGGTSNSIMWQASVSGSGLGNLLMRKWVPLAQ